MTSDEEQARLDQAERDRRHLTDRRATPRGGRRPSDPQGYSPLILIADDDANSGARCVAILARLRFAVAPAHSVDEAIKIMTSLHPTLIVARLKDEPALRKQMAINPELGDIPILTLTPENDAPQIMIEDIRKALRR
jgi:PleD family two-component response regulator